MATVSNQDWFEFNFQNVMEEARLQATVKKEQADTKASLAALTKSLEETLEKLNAPTTAASSLSESAASEPSATPNPNGPSIGQMEQMIADLLGALGELEVKTAEYLNQKDQYNAAVSQALMAEAQAQALQSIKEVDHEESKAKKMEILQWCMRAIGVAIGLLTAGIAFACDDILMGVTSIAMTALSASGAMDKLTQLISNALQKDGLSATAADVIASATIVLCTVAATLATCGMTASSVAEEIPDAAGETAESTVNAGEEGANIAESTADTTTEEAQSFTQRFKQILSKAAQKASELSKKGPFQYKTFNMSLFTGSQAIVGSNFGQYVAVAALSKMEDGKEKAALTAVIEAIVDLMAALAGGVAASAASDTNAAAQLSKLSANFLYAMQQAKLFGYGLQFVGQTTEGAVDFQLASTNYELAKTQTLLSLLQSLISMNTAQMQSSSQNESSVLQAQTQDIQMLTQDLNKGPAALAQVLQA